MPPFVPVAAARGPFLGSAVSSMVAECAAAAIIALVLSSTALAQTSDTATIRGRVVDQTGGVIAGATVTVVNTDTGALRETTTDSAGFFSLHALPVTGVFELIAAKSGFTDQETSDIRLRAGETAHFDITLPASGGTSAVTVYGTASGVRTDEPQLGLRLDRERIEQTPLAGRKLSSLPLLDSAVRPTITTGDLFLNNTLFAINGSGRRQTTFRLDGSSADDAWGRQAIFTSVPLPAIQEFTVLTNPFSAEYGRSTGAAINVVTRSGTNTVRGEIDATFRPAGLEGRDPLANVRTPDALHQVSGANGGPIIRDRTHYFVAAEYTRQERGSLITSPLGPANTFYTGHFEQALLNARVDHTRPHGAMLSAKANVDAMTDDNPQGTVGGLSLPSTARTFTRRAYGVQASYRAVVGPGFNDVHVQVFDGSPITRFNPIQPSVQYLYPGYATLGESRYADLYSRQVEAADSLAVSRGRHNVTVGGNVVHSASGGNGQEFGSPFVLGQFTVAPGVRLPAGQLTAANIQSFQQGFGTSTYQIQEWEWAAFVQDDVRVRSDLTANVGVRYERQTFTDDDNNVAPRLGITYDVAGNPNTVLRAGYAIYYSEVRTDAGAAWELNGPTGYFTFRAAPGQFGFPSTLAPLASFPAGAVLPPRDITIRPGMAEYYSQFLDVSRLKGYPSALLNPSTHLASFGVEHQLNGNWIVTADYVRQHTAGIDRPLDLNSPAPFIRTAPGQVRSAAAADLTRPIVPAPNGYRQILVYLNNGVADYDGLQLNARRRGTRYSLVASYTLSKATNTVEPDVPSQAPNDPNATREAERGPSLLDQRHRFVLSGWTRLPADFAAGGVVTLASGYHYNVVTGVDNNGDGSLTDRPVVNGVVVDRNSGVGRPIYQVDAFVSRTFALGPSRSIALRAEAFNLANRANVAGYDATYGNLPNGQPLASFGTPLGGIRNEFPGRQVQLLARVQF